MIGNNLGKIMASWESEGFRHIKVLELEALLFDPDEYNEYRFTIRVAKLSDLKLQAQSFWGIEQLPDWGKPS